MNEKLSVFLFFFVALFKLKYLTDEGATILMSAMNVVLFLAGQTYRFPVSVSTFAKHSQVNAVCMHGVEKRSVCTGCHKLSPLLLDASPAPAICTTPTCRQDEVIPGKIFGYNSIIATLRTFMLRPNFVESLGKWMHRIPREDTLSDIYDGIVWKTFGITNEDSRPFVEQSRYNLMLTINMDWFQPFTGVTYSTGGTYLTIQNLPREERNAMENVISCGLQPGPKEPRGTEINNYLAPLVDELLLLFDGLMMDVNVNGEIRRETVRAALVLNACDLPAARKLCGFSSPTSNCACHKCSNGFGSLPEDRHRRNYASMMDMSTWIPRTNESQRDNAQKWCEATTATARKQILHDTGARYSELLRLEYFDPVRFTVIDVMHNLYLGTPVRMMDIWRPQNRSQRNYFSDDQLKEMAREARKVVLPLGYDVSSLIRKIDGSPRGFSNLKADEWKTWVIALSPVLLHGRLDRLYFNHWLDYVEANRIIASPTVTVQEIDKAHVLLHRFCQAMEYVYDPTALTPNMHMHLHVRESLKDFGPACASWVFAFERYNGIYKGYNSNQRKNFELTFMSHFLQNVHASDYLEMVKNSLDEDSYEFLFDFIDKAKNTYIPQALIPEIKKSEEDFNMTTFLHLSHISNFGLVKGSEALPIRTLASMKFKQPIEIYNDMITYNCIFNFYNIIYPINNHCHIQHNIHQNQQYIIPKIMTFTSIDLLGQRYKSASHSSSSLAASRGSFISALFPNNGQAPTVRPGQIQFFFCHLVRVENEEVLHTFAFVKWFKPSGQNFANHRLYGMDVWSGDFDPINHECILPVHRINGPVGIKEWLPLERLNVIIPLPRKVIS